MGLSQSHNKGTAGGTSTSESDMEEDSRGGRHDEQPGAGRRQSGTHKRHLAAGGKKEKLHFTAAQFSGIVRIVLEQANMTYKDHFFATVSLGMQTSRTATSISTDTPTWRAEKKIVLEQGGARVARIAIFQSNKIKKNSFVAYCDLDLADVLEPGAAKENVVHVLLNPNNRQEPAGTITLSYNAMPKEVIEQEFTRRLLSLMDYDGNGKLSVSEFKDLLSAFGNDLSDDEMEEIFNRADVHKEHMVSADELASVLARSSARTVLVQQCPVCGEKLGTLDALNDMIHMSLCFDEGTGNTIMTGDYLTEQQASYGYASARVTFGFT